MTTREVSANASKRLFFPRPEIESVNRCSSSQGRKNKARLANLRLLLREVEAAAGVLGFDLGESRKVSDSGPCWLCSLSICFFQISRPPRFRAIVVTFFVRLSDAMMG
jgi:hypothetical protein